MSRILLMLSLLLLTSCGSYSSHFNCGDSKGANCVMLSRIDEMVSSGEITTYHQSAKSQNKCDGKKCNSRRFR